MFHNFYLFTNKNFSLELLQPSFPEAKIELSSPNHTSLQHPTSVYDINRANNNHFPCETHFPTSPPFNPLQSPPGNNSPMRFRQRYVTAMDADYHRQFTALKSCTLSARCSRLPRKRTRPSRERHIKNTLSNSCTHLQHSYFPSAASPE